MAAGENVFLIRKCYLLSGRKVSVVTLILKMSGFHKFIFLLIFLNFFQENFSQPMDKPMRKSMRFRGIVPSIQFRGKRQEEEGSTEPEPSGDVRAEGNNQTGGVGEFFNNVIKDGAAGSASIERPTMIVGGFSVMMQPMPNGGQIASQLMEAAPHYMNLIPGMG